tara:strand:+ start:181 stop:834 length:654 start_codon:yes stop_codon:yes gene_type:complete
MNKGQLVFDLGKVENFNPNDFFISESNHQVSSLLNETNKWFNGSAVVYGKSKSGKTHLLKIWAANNNATFLDCTEVSNWKNLSSSSNYAIDDFHHLKVEKENDFFHFYNNLVLRKFKILCSVDTDTDFKISLNDLSTRFNSFTSSFIDDPDDRLIKILIVKFFSDIQLKVETNVINYLSKRVERDYSKLYQFMEKINYSSMQSKSKITIPFLRDFLN